MSSRIVEIADTSAHLRFENQLLVIESADSGTHTVPTNDLAAVILSNPRVTLTHGILTGLAAKNVPLICSNREHQPVGMYISLSGHSTQAERSRLQAGLSRPLIKRIWQQIVRAKVYSQASLLAETHGSDAGLFQLVSEIRSGDTGYTESTAAQRYWPLLFDDPAFLRKRDAPDQNRFLNYGYAVLHACTARTLTAIGLNPALGVHHRNKYNAYCLASDLMEPFRAWVDEAVIEVVGCHGSDAAMSREIRGQLISSVMDRRESNGELRSGPDIIQRAAWSLLAMMQGRATSLRFPT
jgi:CRISP-associated protein Cas1